ncbi:MAG: PAS domain-containing protein [Chloroflexota bacterium]
MADDPFKTGWFASPLGDKNENEIDYAKMGDMSHPQSDIQALLKQLEGYAPPDFTKLSQNELNKLQLYRIIANQIPQRVFWKDLELRYVWANRRFADDCAVESPEQLVGKCDYDMPWTREQADFYRADDTLVMQTGRPKINIIEPQTRSDGSQAWLHTNKVPLMNEHGEVIGMIGTYEDITERAEAEIVLRRYQQMLESIFNHIPAAIFWKDKNSTYLGCNVHFAKDAGVESPAEIVGKSDTDLPWTEEKTRNFQQDDHFVISSNKPMLNFVQERQQADGRSAWLQVNKVPLHDLDGTVMGVLGTYQNITEQIEAREALRLAKRETFEERQRLARELHDAVSQTLWTASLMADLLPTVWDDDREEGEETLIKLQRLTKGALAEMRMLLLELRPSSLVETDLKKLLERLAEATMSRKKLEISVSADAMPDLNPDTKIGLYRIAQESLNNVARHAKADHAEIELKLVEDEIMLKISDNGRGFSIDSKPSDRMGLNIMQERAADIDAEILIASQPGAGTTITVKCSNQLARRQTHE